MGPVNESRVWRSLLKGCVDLFCPPVCEGCASVLSGSDVLCRECETKIGHWPENNSLKDRISSTSEVVLLPPLGVYEKDGVLARLIHNFKYRGQRYLGTAMALRYAKLLGEEKTMRAYELVLPVPMHWWRRSLRGFNQSAVIAHVLAKQLRVPLCLNVLRRRRYTRRQVGMSANQRKKNIKNSFVLRRPSDVRNKRVLLVDDVLTTGATALACAEVLMKGGAEGVGICVLAVRE